MIGRWLVRILFVGALASISFGILSFDATNDALQSPEGLDEFSPTDASNEESDSPEFAERGDDGGSEAGSIGDSDAKGNLFIGLGSGILAALLVGSGYFRDSTGRPVDGILGMDFLTKGQALLDANSGLIYLGQP